MFIVIATMRKPILKHFRSKDWHIPTQKAQNFVKIDFISHNATNYSIYADKLVVCYYFHQKHYVIGSLLCIQK